MVMLVFFFQAEDGIRDGRVTGVQTCALPISRLLHLLADGCGADALDGRDGMADCGAHRRDARSSWYAVEVHGAGAAQCGAAAEFGAGHAEQVPQDPKQGHVGWRIDGLSLAVYRQCDHGHASSSGSRSPSRFQLRASRKRLAEHGEAALRFGLRRLVLHDVPVLCETSVLYTEDVDDDPRRPPTPTEAPVHHHVGALGDCERAFVPPRETTH